MIAGGLAAPRSATAGTRGAEAMFTERPFPAEKEYLAGFWIMEEAGLDVTLRLAAGGSKACRRKIEMRPFR